MTEPSAPRLILFHKQAASARVRFLRLSHGGVCGPEPCPALAQLIDSPGCGGKLALHPGTLVRVAERRFSLPIGSLEPDGEFRASVDLPGGPAPVFLARFTATDPPLAEAQAVGAVLIDLTQARGLAPGAGRAGSAAPGLRAGHGRMTAGTRDAGSRSD